MNGEAKERAEVVSWLRAKAECRKVIDCREPGNAEKVLAALDELETAQRAIKDVRCIAGEWIKHAPSDWGGDVQAECGRIVLRYSDVAAVSEPKEKK